jgi:hypothetical protein
VFGRCEADEQAGYGDERGDRADPAGRFGDIRPAPFWRGDRLDEEHRTDDADTTETASPSETGQRINNGRRSSTS